jgi:glycosyltransferase involved in cell wall biosynthesis
MKLEDLKIAIVADWLTSRGGAERVVLELADIFPQADIFTSVYKAKLFPELRNRNVYTSFLQTMPFGTKHQLWPTLRPKAIEQLNLDDYDLVISSSSAEAKGIITKPETLHICYCHTPTRYYWSHYHYYLRHPEYGILNPIVSYFMPKLIHNLRLWDRVAADRVDKFIANSHHIAMRIKKYYEADAQVIYPPVDSDRFEISPLASDYYLIVGRQTGYKRTDIAIEAFNQLRLPLHIVGTGPALKGWMLKAGPTIKFLGRLSDKEVAKQMAQCQALIFPQEEDAGIVPLEAMACGRPVIAYRGGGAMETIIPNVTGVFFNHQSAPSLIDAIKAFADIKWKPKLIREHALKFDNKVFQKEIKNFVQKAYGEYQQMQKINPKF